MNMLKAAVMVAVSFGKAACNHPLESARASALVDVKGAGSDQGQATDTGGLRTRMDAYIGETFAEEQKALAAMPPAEHVPNF